MRTGRRLPGQRRVPAGRQARGVGERGQTTRPTLQVCASALTRCIAQDDDGDRWGRDVIALADGRFLVVWVVAGDRSEPSQGIHYNISEDGKTWDASKTVTLMPDTMIVGRYYQAKAIQLDDETLGTVFFRGPQTEMEGIFFAKFPLAMLG